MGGAAGYRGIRLHDHWAGPAGAQGGRAGQRGAEHRGHHGRLVAGPCGLDAFLSPPDRHLYFYRLGHQPHRQSLFQIRQSAGL